MPLLDFKLLLWIKHALKPVSESHLAQGLTSAFLGDLWLAPLTHWAEKCAIEWFGVEGKMSLMLPLWFSFTWEGLDNLLYFSSGPVDHRTSFHIPWRSFTICARYGPKVPMYLQELSFQQGSPPPAYSQFFFTNLPFRLQAVLCNLWISTKFSLCPADTHWPIPVWFTTYAISQEL